MKKFHCILLAALINALPAISRPIDTLKARLFDDAMVNASGAASKVQDILDNMNSNGSFSDVIYATSGGVAGTHPQRLHTLAMALNYPGTSWYNNATLKDRLFTSIEYWVDLNLNDDNWWWRYIGYTKLFWPAVAVAVNNMGSGDAALKTKCIDYLVWAWKYGNSSYKTGANLADIGFTALPGAAVDADSLLASQISIRIQEETEFADKDGIHVDWSFSQHTGSGLQLHSGTYGAEFTKSASAIAHVCRNTVFKFTDETMNRFENHLLKGVRWTSWCKVLDYNSVGRATSRTGNSTYGNGYLTPIIRIIEIGTSGKDTLQAWHDRISNEETGGPAGNRMFWRHDFMIQRTDDWYASVRATSTRTVGNESGNGEGLRNYHMADGVFMHMSTGKEYLDIFPLWDWHKIPGITAELHGNTFPLIDWGSGGAGGSDFAGSASDNNCGLISMIHDRAGVYAKKTWFMTSQCIVAIAASIRSSNPSTIFTTLEQNIFSEKVILSDGAEFTDGDTTLQGQTRLFHDGTLYENLESSSAMKLSATTQSGSWSLINNGGSTDNISKKVFTLGIDHGTGPTDKTYAYGIIPNASADYQNSGKAFPAEVLLNSDTMQVIRLTSGSYTGGVFYTAGMFTKDTCQGFGADKPCVVLLHYKTADSLFIHLSDPPRENSQISFFIEGEYSGQNASYNPADGITTLTLTMPTGMYAGSTVSALLISKITAIHSGNINNSRFPVLVTSVTKGGIRFSLQTPMIYRLSIVSVNGREVFSISEYGKTGVQYKSFGTRPISNGLYYICFHIKNARTVKKILIVE